MAAHTRLLALTLFASLTVATPFAANKLSRNLNVHEARDLPPLGFSLSGPAAPNTPLTLRFALSHSNPDAVVDALQSVSDPSSSNFRQYLSKADVCPSLIVSLYALTYSIRLIGRATLHSEFRLCLYCPSMAQRARLDCRAPHPLRRLAPSQPQRQPSQLPPRRRLLHLLSLRLGC